MNEQTNRHAMIRCVRAMSSMGYPEVFHRFCGYLESQKKFLKFFSGAESQALSRSRRLNFRRLPKKLLQHAFGRASADFSLFCGSGFSLTPASCCARRAAAKIHGENAVAREHQLESRAQVSPRGL